MKYENVTPAVFIDRPNRFIANVSINGRAETVHVKNTGRLRELLVPDASVTLQRAPDPKRKTAYETIMQQAVRKDNGLLINIDSQAPNKAAAEWLSGKGFSRIIPEYSYGSSRIDFFMEKNTGTGITEKYLMEIKGCTLEREGTGYFPDAPTKRGARHLRELIQAAREGYKACAAFVIQMDGITEVLPNTDTDPDFAAAYEEAKRMGVQILFLCCHVEPDSLTIITT